MGKVTSNELCVVIAAFERLNLTIECINSLINAGIVPEQIILADGSSSANTISELRNLFPTVELLCSGENLWWAEAMNVGLEHAFKQNPQFLLLMNQDILVDSDTINVLLQHAFEEKDVDIFASVVLDKSCPSRIIEAGTIWKPHDALPGVWVFSSVYRPLSAYATLPAKPFPVDIFTAHCVLVRKVVFDKIGLYDAKHFPQRGGDDDLGLRATKTGHKIVIVPTAKSYTGINDSGADKKQSTFINQLKWFMFSMVGGRGIQTHFWFVLKHCSTHSMVPTYFYRLINIVRAAWRITH